MSLATRLATLGEWLPSVLAMHRTESLSLHQLALPHRQDPLEVLNPLVCAPFFVCHLWPYFPGISKERNWLFKSEAPLAVRGSDLSETATSLGRAVKQVIVRGK